VIQAGPLAGVRVIDLSINVLGPVATQFLGDMGAEVIKVEPPSGDPMRLTGPTRNPKMSAFFMNINRNKKSVVLDLKTSTDAEALWRLVDRSDVFVHSMRDKAIDRLGFGYEQVAERNPSLIYASAPGYNPDGPHKDRPAYDDVIQGESGLADMMHIVTGQPAFLPMVFADKYCGMSLASAVAMALYARAQTGQGQRVQVPMLETMLSFNLLEHLWSGAFGEEGSLGYPRAFSPRRRPYATQDGFICVMVQSDEQWRGFFTLCGRPDLIDDARFSSLDARTRNIDELYGLVQQNMALRSTGAWLEALGAEDIPCAPVARLNEMPNDQYLAQTRFFVPYEHPSEGRVTGLAIPLKFSNTPPAVRLPPPQLGQHTNEILTTIGMEPRI
jgi:crotonobetainyl-CoA:carnitine CoA-transferase CaiB-like acyl-CoA transferase